MNFSGTAWTRRRVADAAAITEAARLLREGGLVAFPTETVYGLGADATNAAAIAKLYAAKGRPSFNPLIAHVSDAEAAMREGVFSAAAAKLAERFWPGPLTLVVPFAEGSRISDLARAGLPSVGLRVPAHAIAHALLAEAGRPIAAPSANRSGHVSPVSAEHVIEDLGDKIDLVVEGGPCTVGIESTIVACIDDRPRLLRPGGIARAEIEALLGQLLVLIDGRAAGEPIAPGMLHSHYAPRAALRLDATALQPGEAGLDFAGRFAPGENALDLSAAGDTVEAAANLYAHLRRLDASGAQIIAVAPIPAEGLGEAIRDRLKRAAAPR
ncbi:MAG: L-threonylcarbamoyladenylate synthase [Methylobacteriaceae bacterium]|jgi:L-threonylcarbamoyladenylate synthase|nr:L-threonylcarbamoyladenylate synthase [Methylobacteriaceae bacterium]